MELAQIKKGGKYRITNATHPIAANTHVWRLVAVDVSERKGLLLVLEREEKGETIRRQEWATDCEPV